MRDDVIIRQIKALCPFFNGNVAGAADWGNGVQDQVWLPTPAAYVVPLEEDASENLDQGGALYQNLTERVNVFVQFDNSADRRGQTVTENLNPVRYQLYRALLNWRPNSSIDNPGVVLPTDPGADASVRGMQAVGGGNVDFDLKRLFWRFTFQLESVVTDADGWTPPSTPLLGIQGTITSPTGGQPEVEFQQTFSPPS